MFNTELQHEHFAVSKRLILFRGLCLVAEAVSSACLLRESRAVLGAGLAQGVACLVFLHAAF